MADEDQEITWAALKSWAAANKVTDDALVTDQDDRPVRHLSAWEAGDGGPGTPAVLILRLGGER